MGHDRRHGPSISVKMILTTTLLIVVIVAGFGLLNIWTIGRVYSDNAAEKERLIRDQLHRVGTATITAVATSSRTFFEGNNDADLRRYIADLARKDPGISVVYVLDSNFGLVAHSNPALNPQEGHPAVKEPSWERILSLWKQNKDDPAKQDPLIASLELADQAFFARPVFPTGVAGTVKGALEAPSDAERPHGYVVIGYTFDELNRLVASNKQQKDQAARDAGYRTAGVGAIFVLLGTVLAILQGLRISKPIKLLAWRADQIARGELETRVEVSSTDEIGLLGENFNYMADQLVVLLQQTAEKATLEKELEVARAIQETLVPGEGTVDRHFVKLAGFFQPASQCGGDWWTYHDLKDGKVLVVIGDVTGHGVPSAMITAAAKAACDVARAIHHDDVGCAQLLEVMNRAIYESARRKFVMTCFASIIDPRTHSITYANAGHNFPYLVRHKDGQPEFLSLMTRGNRLGDLQESRYAAKTQELLPGDVLIWYTDGIVECENENGEEYGEKRFRASIRRAIQLDPDEMRKVVVGESQQFFGERPRKDDITMVFARIY